jgi:GTP-binding protein SAR1
MVSYITGFFKSVLGYLGLYNKKANLVFLGLDNAGKTTLLHMLKNDKVTQTKPTYHPCSEELKMGNIRFNTFDLGGHESARKIWKDYFPAVDGIIFLVDSSDQDRFPEAKKELEEVCSTPQLDKMPIAILGNKVDKNGAVQEYELKQALDIDSLKQKNNRPLELFMCSVTKKAGYPLALEWLSKYLKD